MSCILSRFVYNNFCVRTKIVTILQLLNGKHSGIRHITASTTQEAEPSRQPEAPIYERKLRPSVTCSSGRSPRLAWLETLKPLSAEDSQHLHPPVGMVDLHPDIFAVFPRLDLIHKNLYWQAHYRMVDWRCITNKAELPYRSTRKPWPQKGTGRARHGNRRTHLWIGGGQCKGPRGPESFYFLLPRSVRLHGLLSTLSVKHAQNDLHIVDNLHLSDSLEAQAQTIVDEARSMMSPQLADEVNDPLSAFNQARAYRLTKAMNDAAIYLRNLVDARRWGPSVLFITEDSPDTILHLPSPEKPDLVSESTPKRDPSHADLSICLACSAYAHHVEMENSPEASGHHFEAIAPRAVHPGRGLTLMPLHSLNVWSMVHHDTVVLSLASLELLESRLLQALTTEESDPRTSESGRVHPMPADWLDGLHRETGEWEDEVDQPVSGGRRHFAESVESPEWIRGQLNRWQ